jgi:hypothetical protein
VKRFALAMMMAGMCLPLISAHADTLELKNGSVIKGTFIGGSEAQLSFSRRLNRTTLCGCRHYVAEVRFRSRTRAGRQRLCASSSAGTELS